MSRYVELIEKVAAAINGGFTESEHAREKARAAIAAVAEWIITEAVYARESRVGAILLKQLETPE